MFTFILTTFVLPTLLIMALCYAVRGPARRAEKRADQFLVLAREQRNRD